METTTYHRPLSQRINFRLVSFLLIISAPFLYAAYAGAKLVLNKGIEDHGSYKAVDLKTLGYFPFDQNTGTIKDVPSRFRALDGQRVELKGYMYAPTGAGDKVRHFQFVYNVTKCCFSGPPLVQERVFANVPSGRSVEYIGDMSRVIGTLHVNVARDAAGTVDAVYTLDVEKAEPIS